MAYIHKDGNVTEGATLGVYRFGLAYTYDPAMGDTTITATCYNDKDSTSSEQSVIVPGQLTVNNWYIEANDTTADIYLGDIHNNIFSGSEELTELFGPFINATNVTFSDGKYGRTGTIYTVMPHEFSGIAAGIEQGQIQYYQHSGIVEHYLRVNAALSRDLPGGIYGFIPDISGDMYRQDTPDIDREINLQTFIVGVASYPGGGYIRFDEYYTLDGMIAGFTSEDAAYHSYRTPLFAATTNSALLNRKRYIKYYGDEDSWRLAKEKYWSDPVSALKEDGWGISTTKYTPTDSYTYANKTVYYRAFTKFDMDELNRFHVTTIEAPVNIKRDTYTEEQLGFAAWLTIHGKSLMPNNSLIGRFEIDLHDAGGTGIDSDWNDPANWEAGWEEGDPTHTLNMTINGATSGTSYSYTPADQKPQQQYGSGGNGGHGGGGGAGASTAVVYRFATDKAMGESITITPKRHGYGSGGGKGGKGGDGCILIFY